MHIKSWLTALSLSMLLWTGRAFGQTDSVAVSDTTEVKKENWLMRLQNRDNSYNGKDVRVTMSLTDLRVRFKAGAAQISPVVGYNLLTNKYVAGVNLGQNVSEGFRFETGYFFRGNFDSETTRQDYKQYYMRGIFNLKSPPGKVESYRRIVVETGGFERDTYRTEETGGYVFGNYEKTLPKLKFFGKKDTNKTLSLGAYCQASVVNGDNRLNVGLRAEMMKPIEFTILKSFRFRMRIGPTVSVDSRDGVKVGYRIVQSLNVFRPKS